MGSTYRGPVCGCSIKRALFREPYEEGPFEMMREGPFWIVSFQKALFGYGRGSMQGVFLRKVPVQMALFRWFLYKELLRL